MDINAEACIKQGEELGMIAKKKSALKYQMQSFANNLICTNPKDSLEKLCQLCLIYEIDAMPLIEVMSENDEQNCQKACQYFILILSPETTHPWVCGGRAFFLQKNKKYLILLLSPEKFVILNMREHKLMKSAERRDTDASKRTGRDDIHKSKTVS